MHRSRQPGTSTCRLTCISVVPHLSPDVSPDAYPESPSTGCEEQRAGACGERRPSSVHQTSGPPPLRSMNSRRGRQPCPRPSRRRRRNSSMSAIRYTVPRTSSSARTSRPPVSEGGITTTADAPRVCAGCLPRCCRGPRDAPDAGACWRCGLVHRLPRGAFRAGSRRPGEWSTGWPDGLGHVVPSTTDLLSAAGLSCRPPDCSCGYSTGHGRSRADPGIGEAPPPDAVGGRTAGVLAVGGRRGSLQRVPPPRLGNVTAGVLLEVTVT